MIYKKMSRKYSNLQYFLERLYVDPDSLPNGYLSKTKTIDLCLQAANELKEKYHDQNKSHGSICAYVYDLKDMKESMEIFYNDYSKPPKNINIKLNNPDDNFKYYTNFLAPETLEKGDIDMKSDIWALGYVFWQIMNNGGIPFYRISIENIIKKLKNNERLRKPNEDMFVEEIWKITNECWSLDPKLRPSIDYIIKYINDLK